MEKQAGIYARYSPGRDRDQTSTIEVQVAICREKLGRRSPNPLPTPKFPTINTFRDWPIKVLDTPEIQKAVVRGLIEEIVIHPTAALDIRCNFSTLFYDHSTTAYRTPV